MADDEVTPPATDAGTSADSPHAPASTARVPGRWRAVFLRELRKTGRIYESCEVAGVSAARMYRVRDKDKEFRRRFDEALQRYADKLEKNLERLALERNNVVANIVALKRHRPEHYNEKTQSQIVNVQLNQPWAPSPEEAQALLASALANMTEESKRILGLPALQGEIADAEVIDVKETQRPQS
jgi:hypothetical protein